MPSANDFDIDFEISDSEDEAEEIEVEICKITEKETSYFEISRSDRLRFQISILDDQNLP